MYRKDSLMFAAFLGDRAGQIDDLRHFEADLFFNDCPQTDIRSTEISDVKYEGAAHCAGARAELPDTPRNQINKNVGVANFLQCFSRKFSVQCFFPSI